MKSIFLLFTTLTLLSLSLIAQKPKPKSALKEMVETEQAFSKTAEVKTTREAFMAFIADDGLLFRPRAVNGKKWMIEHPVQPQTTDKKQLLAWQPSFAGMSAAGDLGFTTGPWEFREDIKDAKPSGYGHFVTLWKRQADGSWKFVLDLGISHPESGGPLSIWIPEEESRQNTVKKVDVAKATGQLLDRDRSYAAEATKSHSVAFRNYAAPDARLYLPDKLPVVGREKAEANLGFVGGPIYTPIAGDVSQSGDLGYTHGTYETRAGADKTKTSESGNYLRIWRNQGGVWQIVLDVTNPVP